jgi:Arc/MetJ-type ribon-helix-helix transcriptional regulator
LSGEPPRWYNTAEEDRMGYPFPPELAEKVRRRLEAGRYQSEDELLADALEALDKLDEQYDVLKTELAVRVDQADRGLAEPLDVEAFLERMRAQATKSVVHDD